MEINWETFTPWASLAGGLLIGLSSIMMIVLAGRIAGISGIVGGLIRSTQSDAAWRLAFLGGLLSAPWLYQASFGEFAFSSPSNPIVLIVAGLLVGYGTRLGSGCTSGHGVCGLSRLSSRSLAATLTFMAVGFLAASLVHPFLS
ncbi:MAG: YeeE/YedE family protein [Limnobacter sp.]|nr:YeeE/YedE family protein [Limnobacter sp.]